MSEDADKSTDVRILHPTEPIVTKRNNMTQLFQAKDPGQENNNEGARPVMQVWKLLQDPRGAEPPSVKSADIIMQVKLLC